MRIILCLLALAASPLLADETSLKTDAPAWDESAGDSLAVRAHFAGQVLPLLETKCFGCHGSGDSAAEPEGELNMLSREALLTGGWSGAAIVPGKYAESFIWQVTDRETEDWSAMPPQDRNALTEAERDILKEWIDAGAPWVETEDIAEVLASARELKLKSGHGGESDLQIVETSGGLSPTWDNRGYAAEDIWAFQPIADPEVPEIDGAADDINPIDAFLLDRMRTEGIDGYAPPADAATLARRLSVDLHGLVPDPKLVRQARQAGRDFDYDASVDELLADPKYGEQLGRIWLDVVRYADTAGFANDYERPNAWRYRDYVIRSFNEDKSFKEFVVEQIAGDELDSSDPENLIATGFLRMGPWEHTGMSVQAITRQQFLDDVTHSVGVTFLGQGMRCCKCHDHKFDPLPTRDYYRMQAVFAPVQFADREVEYLTEENTDAFSASAKRYERIRQDTLAKINVYNKKQDAAKAKWLKDHGYKKFSEVPQAERPQMDIGLTDEEKSVKKVLRKQLAYLDRQRKRTKALAYSVYSGPYRKFDSNKSMHMMPPPNQMKGQADKTHILTGGSVEAPSEQVDPGVISAMAGSNDRLSPSEWNTIPDQTRGRRLALARWIASSKNTLTARVLVNRLWQRHFGVGLVATANNFGVTGSKPTHPELLDYLASQFMREGWSIKAIDRLIVTSDAYRQASSRDDFPQVQEIDSKNELLAVYPVRRMSAEEMRDSMLTITGELNPEMGGLGVFPEINWEVALQPRHIMGSLAPAWIPSPLPQQRHRRAIYHFRVRGMADPLLEVFNKPNADMSCERRDETTVATQAFALFNSQFAQARAVALAARIAESGRAEQNDVATDVEAVFEAVLARQPTNEERQVASSHLTELRAHHAVADVPRASRITKVKRAMVEEMTGRPIEWEEELIGMDQFVPDKQLADLSPHARAIAELALVLMNTNEFIYVR